MLTSTSYTYPGAWINASVAGGLIYLHYSKTENWHSPWKTHTWVAVVYLLLNAFLAITPFIPPTSDWNADGYPYYAFPLVGTGVLGLGVLYWVLWTKVWPSWGGYVVVTETTIDEFGTEVIRHRNVSVQKAAAVGICD